MSDLLNVALSYAGRGWSVLPIHGVTGSGQCTCGKIDCHSAGKHPSTQHGWKDATTDESELRRIFRDYTGNLGIATGAVSGIWVLDVDPKNGGTESFETLIKTYGPFPETVMVMTGSVGGQHFYFRYPKCGLDHRSSLGKEFPGIDIRSDGNLVVAPPSTHKSGRRYLWEASSHPDEVSLSEAPEWLLQLIQSSKRDTVINPTNRWLTLLRDGAVEGERNESVTALVGHLFRRYVDPDVVREIVLIWNQARNRPPLKEDELLNILESIAGREIKRRAEKEWSQ